MFWQAKIVNLRVGREKLGLKNPDVPKKISKVAAKRGSFFYREED
jgi:hypothetical protein